MKRKMGVIEKDLRASLIKYKEDRNLLMLLKSIVCQSDRHIHYNWQYEHFKEQLEIVYRETITNGNPSHR